MIAGPCNHAGSVIWSPWRKGVVCKACGQMFLELGFTGRLNPVRAVSADNPEDLRSLAKALCREISGREPGEDFREDTALCFYAAARAAFSWFTGRSGILSS